MYRLFAYLLLFGFSFCLAHAQTAPTDAVVGHVTGMSGSWRDESCQCSVDQGHTVVRRSKIVRQGAGVPTNFIKIRLWSNQKEELFDCGKIIGPPQLNEYAVEPVDVEMIIPSPQYEFKNSLSKKTCIVIIAESSRLWMVISLRAKFALPNISSSESILSSSRLSKVNSLFTTA